MSKKVGENNIQECTSATVLVCAKTVEMYINF